MRVSRPLTLMAPLVACRHPHGGSTGNEVTLMALAAVLLVATHSAFLTPNAFSLFVALRRTWMVFLKLRGSLGPQMDTRPPAAATRSR